MTYEATTQFLRDHASRSIGQAIVSREMIWQQQGQPPDLDPNKFEFTVEKPNQEAPPSLSDFLNNLTSDQNADTQPPPNAEWLDSQAETWIDTYFPNTKGSFQTVPEDWLVGVLTGSRAFGVPDSVFEGVWSKARDRANTTRQTELRNTAAVTSGRGFTMPTGAMVDAMAQAEQRASESAMEVNIEQAVKDAEIKADLVKTAAGLAVQFRLGVTQAMASFYSDWARLLDRDRDLDRLRARADAMDTFYNAIGRYYDVEVAFEQLRLQAEEGRTGVNSAGRRDQISLYGLRERSADSLGQAVRGFADISSAAANAASTLSADITSAVASSGS